MKRYAYVLDGAAMADKNDFYEQVIAQMTDEPDFTPGHNLDALRDLLAGGFGKHPYGAKLRITWKHFNAAVQVLGETYMLKIIGIMTDANADYDCILKTEND